MAVLTYVIPGFQRPVRIPKRNRGEGMVYGTAIAHPTIKHSVMPDLRDIQRVLIVRPSALGDVCRTVPVLCRLRRRFSDAQIDWLVQDSFVDAVSAHPDLSNAIPFARGKYRKPWKPSVARDVKGFLGELRNSRYDLVLDCQGLARSGLLSWLANVPQRVGFADAKELGWIWMNTRVRTPPGMHTVDRMLALADAVGAGAETDMDRVADMRLYTNAADCAFVRDRFGRAGTRYAVLAPMTRWPGKVWPLQKYSELIDRLLGDTSSGLDGVVLAGGRGDRPACAALIGYAKRNGRVIDAIGETSVGQLMALIEGSAIVIGSDSAAVHVAVGFDRPLVGLYGPTRVERVGPYKRGHDVIQHISAGDVLDHKDEAAGRVLMDRITVDEVFAATVKRLAASPTPHVARVDRQGIADKSLTGAA